MTPNRFQARGTRLQTFREKSWQQMKSVFLKILFSILLRLPNFVFAFIFFLAYPIYKHLHRERAYGRVVKHLENAKVYCTRIGAEFNECFADDMFKGIYWNAIDSYRGLVRMKSVTDRIVFENEEIIRDALQGNAKKGIVASPIAAISIHQGSFELLHRSLCRYSNNVHLVTDTLGNGSLRKVIQELRSDSHLTEYSPDESRALVRNLFKSKGILAMVFDQGKHTKGNKVKLFGQDSTLYLRLPELVNQMGAGIVTFRTFTRSRNCSENNCTSNRTAGDFRGEIVIRFEKYYPPKYDAAINAGDKNSDATSAAPSAAPLVESIAKEVETWIAENPAQWSWNYHGNFKA